MIDYMLNLFINALLRLLKEYNMYILIEDGNIVIHSLDGTHFNTNVGMLTLYTEYENNEH